MLLAINVNNTHTLVGLYDGDGGGALADPHRPGADGRRVRWCILRGLFAEWGIAGPTVTGIVLGSVVPPMNERIEELCRRLFGHAPLVVGPGVRTGVPILYDNPKEVGADRIVNAVAAYERIAGRVHRGRLRHRHHLRLRDGEGRVRRRRHRARASASRSTR